MRKSPRKPKKNERHVLYFYSKEQPSAGRLYWHYVDGLAVAW